MPQRLNNFLLLVLLLFLTASTASGRSSRQDPALEGLELLRQSIAGMKDFSADVIQEKTLSLMSDKIIGHGILKFKKPGLLYMELYSPYASRLLVKDGVLTYRQVNEGGEQKNSLPPAENLNRWMQYFEKPAKSLPSGVIVTVDRVGKLWTLRIVPKKKVGMKEVTVVFLERGALKALSLEERNGDKTVVTFTEMQRNVGLKESEFTLE